MESILTKELTDIEVWTEDGWKPATHIHKTIEYEVYELVTETHTLKCADHHLVALPSGECKRVIDLTIGELVATDTGDEKVISVTNLNYSEHMYDLSVDSDSHLYYTDGILSHNSTVVSIYALWLIMFSSYKRVAILANKEKLAIKMVGEIKDMYEELPYWMKQGIVQGGWNKKTIRFENKSSLECAATSPSAIRGMTVNCLPPEAKINIDKYGDISIAEYYELLTNESQDDVHP